MTVNVIGAIVALREAVRRMSTRNGGPGGSIVNVSSAAAYLGSPNEYIDYAASKGALDTVTIGLSKEVAADGIRVNAVRPGLIRTDIHAKSGSVDRVDRLAPSVPMQRGGDPEEVAEAILWLASPAASYVAPSSTAARALAARVRRASVEAQRRGELGGVASRCAATGAPSITRTARAVPTSSPPR